MNSQSQRIGQGYMSALILFCAIVGSAPVFGQAGTWTLIDARQHPRFSTVIFGIDCIAPDDCAVMINLGAEFGEMVRRTDDAGRGWRNAFFDTTVTGVGRTFRHLTHWDLAYPAAKHIFLACDSGVVRRSSDDGRSWQETQTEYINRFHNFDMYDANFGLAYIKGTRIVHTTDGWLSWRSRDLESILSNYDPDVPPYGINDIKQISPDSMIALCVSKTSRLIVRSTDGGESWEAFKGPPGCRYMHFVTAQEGWAVGGVSTGLGHRLRDQICHTTDGGVTWEMVYDEEVEPAFGLWRVDFADRLHGIAVGNLRKIYFTSDGGRTWRQPAVPPTEVLHNILRVSYPTPRRAYIGNSNGDVIRWDAQTTTVTERAAAATTGLRCYPQPAEDELRIALPAAAAGKDGVLVIRDLLGRRILSRTVASALPAFDISTRGLAAGQYLLHYSYDGDAGANSYSASYVISK